MRVCKPVRKNGRRTVPSTRSRTGLRPVGCVNRGEFALNGCAIATCARSFLAPTDLPETVAVGRAITRKLRLLRAHGLIRKVSNHRYLVTEEARRIIRTAQRAECRVEQLTKMAA